MNEIVKLIFVEERMVGGNLRRIPHPETGREVFARLRSAGEREYYDANAAGYNLALKAEVWTDEYQGERQLEYDGKSYSVIRSYRNDRSRCTELSCERIEGRD